MTLTGSLVVGATSEDTIKLHERVKQLTEVGVRAEFLSSRELQQEEPALVVQEESGAAFLPGDSQLDAPLAVAYIEKVCQCILYKVGNEQILIVPSSLIC